MNTKLIVAILLAVIILIAGCVSNKEQTTSNPNPIQVKRTENQTPYEPKFNPQGSDTQEIASRAFPDTIPLSEGIVIRNLTADDSGAILYGRIKNTDETNKNNINLVRFIFLDEYGTAILSSVAEVETNSEWITGGEIKPGEELRFRVNAMPREKKRNEIKILRIKKIYDFGSS